MLLSKSFKRLKASSLVESVIAIVIISICVLVAFMIYLNVIKQNYATAYYNAKHKIEELTLNAIEEEDFVDDTFKIKGAMIAKHVELNKEKKTANFKFIITTADKEYTITKIMHINTDE